MNFQKLQMQKFLSDNNLSALLLTNLRKIFWYSTVKSSNGALLITKDKSYFFIDSRYKTYVNTLNTRQNIDEIVIIKNYQDDMLNKIKEILNDKNIKEISLEDNISVKQYFFIKDFLNNCKLNYINTDDLLIQKTDKEVENIKKGCNILAKGIDHIKKWIKPGVTEKETATELEKYFFSHPEVQGLSFGTIVAFNTNSALPHAKPSSNKLLKNDIVLIDCGVIVNGYCSDQTRTFFINNPNPKLIEIYNIVLSAQELAIKNIKANMKVSSLDAVARNYISDKKYGEYFFHNLGHGLGINIHEEPFLSTANNNLLKPLSVITIEPGIYIEGLGGVRIEDDVYVKENGIEILNTCPKQLEILKKI